jgi:2-C-methyl-D-erythritol 4-phosphate cytidylyltransferase
MHKYAIIVAGGIGARMGGEIPKQFQLLKGKPVLWHTLKAFTEAFNDLQIILVLPENNIENGEQIVKEFSSHHILITTGGNTRFQSVKNGLKFVENESIVFVHDAVRCLVSVGLIHRCYKSALRTGNAVPAIASKDSVRVTSDKGNEPVDRNKVMLVQTPQTFLSKVLLPAFQINYDEKFTDEATVVEAYGIKILLVDGEENNIKITRPADLLIAEKILEERQA